MRCLRRNKETFYFAKYIGKFIVSDEYGNETGESELRYEKPMKWHANISAAQGEVEVRQFGSNLDYDKVIVSEVPLFDENAVLWIDCVPVINPDGTTDTPYDYIVKRIAESLNSYSYAVKKVNVS